MDETAMRRFNGAVDAAESPNRRKLMLVSYWYPPAVGAGADRAAAFTKYLPEHGWECFLLTADRTGGAGSGRAGEGAVRDPAGAKGVSLEDYDPRRRANWLQVWAREIVFPDRFVFWGRTAAPIAVETVRREGIGLVLATFPPASAVSLALRVCRRTGTRFVLDLRDRWFGPGGYDPLCPVNRWRHARLERKAISRASAVVTISEAMAEAVAAEHGYDRRRIIVIPNGYEREDGAWREPPGGEAGSPRPDARQAGSLVVSHVGTVIPRNRPDLFLQSVGALAARGGLRDVVFRFVGNLSEDYVRATGLSAVVQTTGVVARAEAVEEMRRAGGLLLLTGAYVGRWGYNAKVFEYIRSGRPILCVEEEPGSNDRKLLEQFAAGRSFFAMAGDPESLGEAVGRLCTWVKEERPGAIEIDPAFEAYDRRESVRMLAKALDGLVV
jgi:glycosyltransferase involved in cell wall biosynthesis